MSPPQAQPIGPTSGPPAARDAEADAALVRRARDGSRQAFAQLYDRYAGLIRAVAYDRCGDRAEANELAQETFFRAFRGMNTLKDPAKFVPWLLQIARHTAAESIRGKIKDRAVTAAAAERARQARLAAEPDSLEHDELHRAVADLPEPDRTAVRLFYLCEEPADQARGVLGLSRAGFYKALARAKQTLHKRLDPTDNDTGAKA